MKRTITILLLLFILFTIAPAQEPEEESHFFEPPEWIIGTWSNASGEMGFRFEENNVVQVSPEYNDFESINESDMTVCFIDTCCAAQYSFTVLVPSAFITQRYDFMKTKENALEFVSTYNDVATSMVLNKK